MSIATVSFVLDKYMDLTIQLGTLYNKQLSHFTKIQPLPSQGCAVALDLAMKL
jgi:hypothetical protein